LKETSAALLGLAAAGALMVVVWVGSLVRRDASLVDRFWGLGFVVVALVYWWSAEWPGGGAALLFGLVAVWGVRLSGYLTWRNWGHGEDYRYRAMRAKAPGRFGLTSLATVFLLQAAILWVVSLPLLVALRRSYPVDHPLVAIGALLWLVGFYFEAVGDWQLTRFRADPGNRGKVLDRGVWRLTRHPNYFGDACLWWGFFGFAAANGAWWTVIGPVLMNLLLLKVSGVALLERRLVDAKPQYRDYVARTNAFIPWRPKPRRDAPSP